MSETVSAIVGQLLSCNTLDKVKCILNKVTEPVNLKDQATPETLSTYIGQLLGEVSNWVHRGSVKTSHEADKNLTAILRAIVSFCRTNLGGVPPEILQELSPLSLSLANRCLQRLCSSNKTAEAKCLTQEIRGVLRAIAIGAIEAGGSGSGEEGPAADPMAPAEVGRVFDAYAPSYDSAMESLRYSVPERLGRWAAEQMEHASGAQPGRAGRWGSVVDLGCGTGIVGSVLRGAGHSGALLGCDLSPGMALAAAMTGAYTDVRVSDCSAFLDGLELSSVSLIVAADVLEYIGDVGCLFASAFGAMEPGAWLVASAESLEGTCSENTVPGFALLPTERFAHSRDYLQIQAEHAGFRGAEIEALPCLREEDGEPLRGWLAFLKKPA